ncbi:MarR family transcriptional regulator [Streptomyces sp. DSM 44917]|uniref:MarR family transcriptional regulator n=1 Tax=Streptomyces boetiae TaxID=3075541 RepID=A0ABU2L8F3_9ACTN|nr:MarR family transcriptional regulator [Streptomyces sp. DSM 44917]MDT0307493.1 MarR family transcriptional regulator [Streptomyces sp. DSM 44917]
MTAAADLPAELSRVVWTLHRTLRQTVRPPEGEHVRPPAQVELLHLVHDRPGISVREAARALRMQPNNVSALVTLLVRDGFLERAPDPADRRAVQLRPTAKMRAGGEQVDSALHLGVAAALADLPAESRARIAAALPDLRRLAERLARDAG